MHHCCNIMNLKIHAKPSLVKDSDIIEHKLTELYFYLSLCLSPSLPPSFLYLREENVDSESAHILTGSLNHTSTIQIRELGARNLGLSLFWQKPNYLSHRCCLPGSALAGCWSQELAFLL